MAALGKNLLRRPLLACLIAGLLPVLVRLLLLPVIPVPVPKDHDEFSYLLGADTFAHGRLTNPPHPMWVHFEAPHVIQQPTYSSKYFPAQALFLAFGQRLFGHPWAGVVLSIGVMCACLCWMLQGWVSPGFALLAASLAALGWGVTDYWMNSYWGGAVPALFGALVIGAVPRLVGNASAPAALLGVIGAVGLANCRPFEGGLTVLSAAAVFFVLARRDRLDFKLLVRRRVILPAAGLIVAAAAFMAYYDYQATGNPLLPPYLLYERQYGPLPHFFLLPPTPKPVYRDELFSKLWDWENSLYLAAKSDPLTGVKFVWPLMANLFVLNAIGVAALLGVIFGKKSVTVPALGIIALPLAGVLAQKAFLPHYLAPFCGAYLLIAAAGLEACGRWRIGRRRTGHFAVALLAGTGLGIFLLMVLNSAHAAQQKPTGIAERPLIIRELLQQGGKHLVIVRYSPTHFIHEDWVYNQADIDGSPIVWAKDKGQEEDQRLIQYFRDRRVWLLEPDRDPLALRSFVPGS